MFLNSLSGRFLVLTILFVMLAEVLIFVPSIARFRQDYMDNRLERAQIASLALLANDMIDEELEEELLRNAGVFNVVLLRDEVRQLMLASDMPSPIAKTFDLRDPPASTLIMDAMARLVNPEPEVVRVIGNPTRDAGQLIEITMPTEPLRAAMLDYGIRILLLSAMISIVTATLLFFAVRQLLVRPIEGVVEAMKSYAEAPEDARRIIEPKASVKELSEAENALKSLQTELTSVLRQRERLASLGSAVAKVSHDLRNILTAAQLFADRIETSEDPVVARMAPKLVGSIGRAVNLCESTLAFGKAEEPPPALDRIDLTSLVQEVVDSERLAANDLIEFDEEISPGMIVRADPEQLYRVISNLIRNARQALEVRNAPGRISVEALETDSEWLIHIRDDGPGLPKQALEHLFKPFQGGTRKGGTGLGLAIAAELVRGHGGELRLSETGETGTTFSIVLPKGILTDGGATNGRERSALSS
ncbi:MAG: HAMP domain-containing sensor histidine kinase [Boseongicola sp.]|nr:HAMP domain-containing sensor histidine kinase [Boseongicola sp.]MDD9978508.1 HAMP domain-containing sensor histidine kinase [Boseongicola sp.]